MQASFFVQQLRYQFRTLENVHFGAAGAANDIRGALGWNLRRLSESGYDRLFQPRAQKGPSGLADRPRPFVLRASHLDGKLIPAGSLFQVDVHLFQTGAADSLREALAEIATRGIGVGRGKAEVVDVESHPIRIDLGLPAGDLSRVRVEFVTPTELKSEGVVVHRPDFAVLFSRVRDRVATLTRLYGEGALNADFAGSGERARAVSTEACSLQHVHRTRRSSRTGETHELGGFTGEAIYSGELGEFWPWLEAAQWTGVGRHTVWGKGQIRLCRMNAWKTW